MRMKAKRKAERDRARRDASTRLREAPPVEVESEDTRTDVSDDIDLRIERSLRGYDE
jgi:hypothetical protein